MTDYLVGSLETSDCDLQELASEFGDESDSASLVAIVALAVGSFSLLMNLILVVHSFASGSYGSDASSKHDGGIANRSQSQEQPEQTSATLNDDDKTLGSKHVAESRENHHIFCTVLYQYCPSIIPFIRICPIFMP